MAKIPQAYLLAGFPSLRSDRDSNSGYAFGVYTLSRRASSATRAPLLTSLAVDGGQSVLRCKVNEFF